MSTNRLFTAVLFLASLSAVHSLTCHEGFNVSISGVPFYFWAELDCAANSECFIQEITYEIPDAKMKDIVLRFGGCISKQFLPYITCEQLYGENSEITLDIAFAMLRGLEGKFDKINKKMVTDSQSHLHRFFSRGNGPDEFFSGVLEFLESIGFDGTKIEEAFNRFVRSTINLGLIPKTLKQWEPLVLAATVDNDATKKLSGALLVYVLNLLDGQVPDSIAKTFIYGPGLAYPMLQSMYSADEVNDVYMAIAEGFENLDIENPVPAMLDYQDKFLRSLLIVQLSASEAKRESAEEIYQKTKKAIHFIKKVSPTSPFPDSALAQSDIVYKYATETNFQKRIEEAEKSPDQLKADIRDIKADLRKQLSILDSSLQVIVSSIVGVGMNVADPLSDFIILPVLTKLMRESERMIDRMIYNPPGLPRALDMLQPAMKKLEPFWYFVRKECSPNTCQHRSCTENLCNSNEAFSHKNDFDGTVGKEEL